MENSSLTGLQILPSQILDMEENSSTGLQFPLSQILEMEDNSSTGLQFLLSQNLNIEENSLTGVWSKVFLLVLDKEKNRLSEIQNSIAYQLMQSIQLYGKFQFAYEVYHFTLMV